MSSTEGPAAEALYTYDARPQIQDADNRPLEDDQRHRVMREVDAAVQRWKRVRPADTVKDSRGETLVQVAIIFAFAMLGAALFQAAWFVFRMVG